MSEEEKKIIIDEDWKSQVEAEKSAAAEVKEQGTDTVPSEEAPSTPEDPQMPPASIGMLMSSLATEALLSMGQFPHPATGQITVRRNQAQYLIDTLAMLKEKTSGNLTSEEAIALDDVIHQLRMAFISSPANTGSSKS